MAEEHVLGACLMSGLAIEEAAEIIQPGDFYRESYGIIFHTLVELHESGGAVDAVTASHELERRGKLLAVGGEAKLAELVAITPTASNVAHYARIVKEKAVFRRLEGAGLRITQLGKAGEGVIEDVIASAEAVLTEALSDSQIQTAQQIDDGLDEWLAELRASYEKKQPIRGFSTGVTNLDAALGGLWPGQFVCLAARPGMGKSTLALNIADNMADYGRDVLFASAEMSRAELRLKSLARLAEIDSLKLQSGQITPEEAQRLGKAVPKLRERASKLLVHDEGVLNISTIRAEASRLKRRGNLGLVVVDYVQLLSPPSELLNANRSEQIGSITRGLKQLAMRLHVPVLGISQMNRAIEQRHLKRPTLSDLRESGTLEQDSDVVLFIHDDAEYDPDKASMHEVIIAKARRGTTMTDFKLKFNKPHNLFGGAVL